jgi:hypothetical protein
MDPREFEEVRHRLEEIHANQKRVPPLWAVVAAFLVPSIGGLVMGGQLVKQVEDNRETNVRQEAHIESDDNRIAALEQRFAVMSVLIQLNTARLNVVEPPPFQDSPTSPPGPARRP